MSSHKLTAPIAAIGLVAIGVFAWGQNSLLGGGDQPSRHIPNTPSSMKNSPPSESAGGDPANSNHSKIVSQGVSTEKKGKAAFQDAVKETRSGKGGKDGSDLETQIDNRTPSGERVARGGN